MTRTYLLCIFFIIQKILHPIVNNRNLISVQNNYPHIHKNMALDNNILIYAISENRLRKNKEFERKNTFPNIIFSQISFINKLNIHHPRNLVFSLRFYYPDFYLSILI